MTRRLTAIIVLVVLAIGAAGCAASRAARRGNDAARLGDWDAAVAFYTRAVQDAPDRADYKIELERAMLAASRIHVDRARQAEQKGELEQAILEYRKSAEFDPSNRQAAQKAIDLERTVRDRLEAARPKPAIAEMREKARREGRVPDLNPASRAPIDLRFQNASTQDILNFIGTSTGINIMYERDFRPSTFSVQLNGLTLEDALNQILSTNQLWYKVINDRTILIIPDNAQKRQTYEDQVIRTFFISHADPAELVQLLNSITRIQGLPIAPVIAVNKAANTITIRATRGVAEVIERIIETNDKPRAELVVDVEILEVNRSRAKQYGLNLSQYSVGTIFSPEAAPGGSSGTSTTTSTTGSGAFNLNTITRGVSAADFYLTVPQAVVRFLATDSQSRLIAKPQLRGREGTKLTLNLGDEIPVPSTVFTPFAAGGVSSNPLTSFSYRNVGINFLMTPRVSYEGDILMDVEIESSTLGGNIEVAGQSLPTFGTRKVTTSLRLREGESHLLAGLLREEDRRSLRGLPGIMNLPILRQLFSDNDLSTSQTDIVMLLTPRIVRTHEITAEDLAPIFIGSQQSIGLSGPPPLINPNAEPEPAAAPAAATPATPTQGAPLPAVAMPGPPAPGMPQAPSASAPGAQRPPVASPSGSQSPPVSPSAPVPRLPDGTSAQPTVPQGSSPIPGTTTMPPTAPAVPAPAPAQILVSTPGNEFRVGGGPYTVPLSIANASRASTVSVSVTFNPAALRVRSVQESSFLRQGGVAVAFTHQVDAANGRIDITMTRTGDQSGAAGSGLLAAILFDAIGPGTAVLSASGVVTAPDGTSMPVQFVPASVTVR